MTGQEPWLLGDKIVPKLPQFQVSEHPASWTTNVCILCAADLLGIFTAAFSAKILGQRKSELIVLSTL